MTFCTAFVRLTVRAGTLNLGRDPSASAKAGGRITFASSVTNIPPSSTAIFKLPLTKNGRKIVKRNPGEKLKARLEVLDFSGALVSNTPIRLRLR